ncbi:MAG: hypothetical protein ACUVQ0_05105 [Thermoproteota archaeon]
MKILIRLKPLILLILFNYSVIVFGSWILFNIEVNIERALRPILSRLVIGFVQALIGTLLVLTWIFVWLELYKYLFTREIRKLEKA